MQTNPKGNDQIFVRYLLCKGKTTTKSILDKTQNITSKQESQGEKTEGA